VDSATRAGRGSDDPRGPNPGRRSANDSALIVDRIAYREAAITSAFLVTMAAKTLLLALRDIPPRASSSLEQPDYFLRERPTGHDWGQTLASMVVQIVP
jgi:hypothetical protein